MTHTFRLLTVVLFYLTSVSCVAQKSAKTNDVLNANALKPYGRFALDQGNLELISSAVHFGFSFEGTECRIYSSIPDGAGHNYLQYELDGVYKNRIRIEAGSKDSIILKAASSGKHTVWIYKATEAHTGPIFIQKVSAHHIKALKKPSAPIIEFIGNSITCGAAADPSEVPCGTGVYHDQHNAYMAYGPRVARMLNADFVLSSVSGIGIYRNWNSNGPAMPQVYEKTDFQDNSTRFWDFNAFTPKVVSIALGTNDFSNGDGKNPRLPFDSTSFITNYVKFIQLVKSKYPQAQIALLSSAMLNGETRNQLQACLTSVKQKADALYPLKKPIALFFFEPMQPRGCTYHPSVEDHEVLAKQLAPFFQKLLK